MICNSNVLERGTTNMTSIAVFVKSDIVSAAAPLTVL